MVEEEGTVSTNLGPTGDHKQAETRRDLSRGGRACVYSQTCQTGA